MNLIDLLIQGVITSEDYNLLRAMQIKDIKDIYGEWEELIDCEEFSWVTLQKLKEVIWKELKKEVKF